MCCQLSSAVASLSHWASAFVYNTLASRGSSATQLRRVDIVCRILSYPYSHRVSDVDTWWQLRHAFSLWSNVSSLTFEDVGDSQPADIDISFVSRYHNDGSPFDGEGLIPYYLSNVTRNWVTLPRDNSHVLHKFLPPQSDSEAFEHYDLRQPRHNFSLPARNSHLADNNFFQRMLYHRVYWRMYFY